MKIADKQFDNTNTGVLFKAKEQKTEKHPGYTGTINIDGQEFRLAGWVRQSKQGEKFFSLSVSPKEKKVERQGGPTAFDDLDSPPF
jgi:redox-regulated HSP33 family molecular chaperone